MKYFGFVALLLFSTVALATEPVNLFESPVYADSNLADGISSISGRATYNSRIKEKVKVGTQVSLNLFGKTLEMRTQFVTRKENGRVAYSANNVSEDTINIAENNGKVVGSILSGGNLYKIRPVGNGEVAVTLVPNEELIDHGENYREDQSNFDAIQQQINVFKDNGQNADSGSEYTVIVAYTAGFAAVAGSVAAFMDLLELETNTSYTNSQVNTRVKIVHSYQTAYTDSGDFNADLNYFLNASNAETAQLYALRDTYYADIMILLTGNNYAYCGMAPAIGAHQGNAIAAASETCATGYYSFAHEIGHLFGARHIITQDSHVSPYAYAHGYCNTTPSTFRTVMAYNCPSGSGGSRRPWWSNPNVSIDSYPTGTATYENNALLTNVRVSTVANFRQSPVVSDDGGFTVIKTKNGKVVVLPF